MRFSRLKSQRLVSKYLPLGLPATDHITLVNKRSVLAMFELQGYPWETQSEADIIHNFLGLNTFCHNIAHETIILHFWRCRGFASESVYPSGKFSSAFAESLDIAHRDNLFRNALFRNTIFLGIEIIPPSITGSKVGDATIGGESGDELPEVRIERLKALCGLLQVSLAAYHPRLLGMRDEVYHEPAETIAYAMTGHWRPIGLTNDFIGTAMLSEDVHVGWETLTFQPPGGDPWYGAMFGMRRHLKEVWPGILDKLLAVPFRYTLYQSYKFIPTQEAQTMMRRKQAFMVSGRDAARSEAKALDEAAEGLGSANWVIGDHCLSLLAFASDAAGMREVTTAAWGAFSSCGIVVGRENLALESAWASICPGNHGYRPRPAFVSSLVLGCFESLHAYPTGKAKDYYWDAPIAVFRTVSGEPYLFDPFVDDVGNLFITGRVGSGKSTMLAFLVAQAGRLGAQVILWDKDYGLKILVHHLDGIYLELGNPTGLAPLRALAPIPEDIDFLVSLLTNCILSDNLGPITAEESRRLYMGVVNTMTFLPPEQRGLWNVRCFLGVGREGAGARLEKWCWRNELGWVIDNPEDKMRFDAPVVGMDKTKILDHAMACAPTMATTYYYTGKLIDGRRIMFVADEIAKDMENKHFAPMIGNQLKARSRKGNAPTILATQSPRDVLKNPDLSYTIKEQCPSHMAFAPGEADWNDFGEKGLGYTEAEYNIIRGLPSGTGEFLLRQGSVGNRRSVRAQLVLGGLDDEIAIMSGRDKRVKLFNSIMAEVSAKFRAAWRTDAAA